MSTAWVLFLVVSAASPITSLVGTASLAFVQGNGAGLPAAYAAVTLVLACFAVGYAAISRRVINTGAFYTYVARGIGRPPAIGAGLLAIVAYTVNVAGIAGAGGYFTSIVAAETGLDIGWVWGSAVLLGVVGLLGYRSVHVSAMVLGSVVVVSVAVLLVFDVLVLAERGLDALPAASFAPRTILSGSPGMAAIFALTCFVGIETAALYSEETTDPDRRVPRVIYTAVAGMGAFYVLSTWILVGSIGADRTREVAAAKLGNLVFDEMARYGGEALRSATGLLFLAATFAGMLAFHNAASRYLLVLGRDRVLPGRLARVHPRHRSPQLGSLTVTAAATLIVAICAIVGLDPFVALAQGAIGLATLGIVSLQAIAAVAIVAFFRQRGQGRYWGTLILPSIGAVGLTSAAVFLLFNFSTVFGGYTPVAVVLPWLLAAVGAGGVGYGLILRRRRPARYARLAQSRLRPQARRLARPARWTRRYCLIGAGPAGLAMARRLAEEGVPFDWFERHSDIGGVWHADRPDGPMYETCVSISSKFTSGFPDLPMPGEYPDYPAWWQVRDYLRHYAEVHGLYDRVTLNTAVTWAAPEGVGWHVTLTSGDFRYYSGIIAAPGTGWHPALPAWPGQESFGGQIWHSARYRSPAELAGKRVLVVGSGNSGVEIACDAARAGALTYLSMRRGRRLVPRYVGVVPTDAVLAGLITPEAIGLPTDPAELVASLTGDPSRQGLPQPDHRVLAGHPTVTDDLPSFVSQRWIHPRPEVAEILPGGVRFVDGSTVDVDLIIAATGFERRVPFLAPELYCAPDGRLDLYLNVFGRTHDGLAILGLSDFAGATFPRFDDMARTVIVDLTLRELNTADWRAWQTTKQQARPDLRGGLVFVDSLSTATAVDDHAYHVQLRDVCDQFGYSLAPSAAAVRAPVGAAVAHR